MIINSISSGQRAAYYCNGSNDDIALVTFIANLRSRGYSNFTVEIVGAFVKSQTAVITIDNSGFSQITLDFSDCDRVTSRGAFLDVTNVRVINLSVYHQNNAADADIYTFTGDNAIFENCQVTGAYRSGICRCWSLVNSKMLNCDCEITNNGGNIHGVYGSGILATGLNIFVKSLTASAYGVEATGSFISDSKFKGDAANTLSTASGNGGIGGGYYSNCLFLGIGNLKGQGFYLRGGFWLTANNCVFRGYTKNTASGWGIGLTGQSNSGNTLSLLGINCNQETLSGYSQTASMQFADGYGAYIGTFYAAPAVSSNIIALASYNRNRT